MRVGAGSARLLVLAVGLAAVLTASSPAAAVSSAQPSRAAYDGLGTWLDIYATKHWRDPEQEVAAMAQDGVRTLYLETANYRQSVDLVRPSALGRFIDAAHASGMRVVAWYLPSFRHLRTDERRTVAAIRFRSENGERFDGFALDIEATSVRNLALRDTRLLQFSAWLRRTVGPRYALGAITPSPIGMSPSYWPDIPYSELTRYYDVFLPMAYSTLRAVQGAAPTRAYLTATVAAIRAAAGNARLPIHLVGGLSADMGPKDTAGFMGAVADCRLVGYSLYRFPTTRPSAWPALTAPPRRGAGTCS